MKTLKLEGTPEQRRRRVTCWIEVIKDVLRTNHKTAGVLVKYPQLPESINKVTNRALGAFLRAYVAQHVKDILNGIDAQDGLEILRQLQNMYAHATIQDRNKAVADLTQLQMHPRDTIIVFVAKFRKAVKAIADVSMGIPMPSDQELVNLFIQKCLEVVPEGTAIRSSLLDYQRAIKFNGNNPILPFTLSQVEHELTQQENNKKKIIRAQPGTRSNHRPREQANATNIREQANAADTTKNTKFRKSVS